MRHFDDPRYAADLAFAADTAKFYFANRDLLLDGTMCAPRTLDFTAHAASLPDVPELIRATAESFHRGRDMELLFHAFPQDAEKIAAVKSASGRLLGATRRIEIYSI